MNYRTPDLTQHPPRSPRIRLGGLVMLPRMLDKGRAALAGTSGEYHYNCPMDQRLLGFLGVAADAVKKQLATGKSDQQMLEWILANSTSKPGLPEIMAWSALQEQRAPSDLESREFFNELHKAAAPHREDVQTWFDLLDLDDYVSFGGAA